MPGRAQDLPTEAFGLPLDPGQLADSVRGLLERRQRDRLCPFLMVECPRRYPICSVAEAGRPIAICPHRLLEGQVIFRSLTPRLPGARPTLLRHVHPLTGRQLPVSYSMTPAVTSLLISVEARHLPLSSVGAPDSSKWSRGGASGRRSSPLVGVTHPLDVFMRPESIVWLMDATLVKRRRDEAERRRRDLVREALRLRSQSAAESIETLSDLNASLLRLHRSGR